MVFEGGCLAALGLVGGGGGLAGCTAGLGAILVEASVRAKDADEKTI